MGPCNEGQTTRVVHGRQNAAAALDLASVHRLQPMWVLPMMLTRGLLPPPSPHAAAAGVETAAWPSQLTADPGTDQPPGCSAAARRMVSRA